MNHKNRRIPENASVANALGADDVLLSWQQVGKLLGGEETPRSRRQIYNDVRDGRLPPPVEVGPNCVRWWRGEILAALRNRPRRTYRFPDSRPEAA
jgi:predicted DNA-binding transcriptional regulator AlpA